MYGSLVTYGGGQAGVCVWKRADLSCTQIELVYVSVYLSVFFFKNFHLKGSYQAIKHAKFVCLSVCRYVIPLSIPRPSFFEKDTDMRCFK